MSKIHLLSLAEPGTDGGSGGGGPADSGTPTPAGLPPLPSVSARERIYDAADAAPNSGPEGVAAPAAAPAATPTPPEIPDSAKVPAPDSAATKGDKGKTDPVAEKRVKDAQGALTQSQQLLADEKRAREAAEARLAKVGKYVDFDKLEEHDKTEHEKELDRPVTLRDLEGLKAVPAADPAADAGQPAATGLTDTERQTFLTDYYEKNAHVAAYAKDGSAYGVFLKEAERLGPAIAGKPELEQLQAIGEAVATHFRNRDAETERAIAERLNTKRVQVGAGASPPSGGAPGTGEAEDPGDDPATEVAHRNALRNRVLRPAL